MDKQLYSTGNYSQSPGIEHDEKNIYIYMYMYVCMTESLCYTAEIGTSVNQVYFNKK